MTAISTTIAILVLIINSALIVFACLYLISFKSRDVASVVGAINNWLANYRYQLAFVTVLIATLGSLFYSELAGYDPCKLCWIQRVFMYPQVLILGLAWWINDKTAWVYALALSLGGLIVAIYHYVLQLWPDQVVNCSIVGQATSCSGTYLMEYGYMTIPLMAASAFAVVCILMLIKADQD